MPLPPQCYRCQRLTRDFACCPKCRPKTRLAHVWISGEYEDTIVTLVRLLKFQRVRAAAIPVAEYIAETLPQLPLDVCVTHVPTATSRRRQRGYDQAEVIAREVARLKGLSHHTLLAREGQARQVGSSRSQRAKQLDSAFRIVKGAEIHKKILLIDDILTTGSTLQAAAKVLHKGGASTVYGAVFARKR